MLLYRYLRGVVESYLDCQRSLQKPIAAWGDVGDIINNWFAVSFSSVYMSTTANMPTTANMSTTANMPSTGNVYDGIHDFLILDNSRGKKGFGEYIF